MKHRHNGRYRSRKPKGGTTYKKKPLHPKTKKIFKIFMNKHKHLSWPQIKKSYPMVNPLADDDGDGVLNKDDCRPWDKKRQDLTDDEVRLATTEELVDLAEEGELTERDVGKIEDIWGVDLSEFTERNWDIDEENILNSTPKYGVDGDIKRFMFEPNKKKFIMGGDILHSLLLHSHKTNEPEDGAELHFDDFVRGIYSRKANKVFIRTWFKPSGPYDNFDADDWDASFKMQDRLAKQLKTMGVPEDVEIVYDTDNKKLNEELGGRGW